MVQKATKSKLSEKEQTILGVIYSVQLDLKDTKTKEYSINDKKIKLDLDGISFVSKRRLGDDPNFYSTTMKSLLEKNMLIFDNGIYSLTKAGRKIGLMVRSKWYSEYYDDILYRCVNSKAYAEFCKQVYGENLFQFNVVDMQQLDMMFEKLKIKSSDVVLDLGCGLGKISEYIAKKTGADVTAIDFSEKSIEWANVNATRLDNIKFEVVDINELNYPVDTFDVIIGLDVLYWLDNLDPVLEKMKEILKPDGRMGFFYVHFKDKEDLDKPFSWENFKLAKLLEKNDFSFDVVDISQEAVDIWKQKIASGKELREQFVSEKNEDIIDSRLNGGRDVIKKFESNEQKRYFYFVKNK